MRSGRILTLALIALFVFSLVDLSGSGIPVTNSGLHETPTGQNQVSEAGGSYVGTGSSLDVSFSGTFINSSSWTDTTTTLSSEFTPGTSFEVSNASTVLWTAYILVSPPSGVDTLGFTVDYNETEWTPVSLTDPIGESQTYPTEWWYETGLVFVSESAVTTYGVWKIEFTAMNHLSDLELGLSTGGLSTTASFGLNDEMLYRATSSWITGATTEFVLTDPTGTEWYTGTNTTSSPSTHLLQSFRYRKVITIDRSRHLGTNVNNFPVMIELTDIDLQTDVQSDGDDILFVSGGKILSHQIEIFEQGTGYLVAWVKTNLTGSTNTEITMYYGNPLLGNMENPDDVWTESFASVWHLDEAATAGQSTTTHYDSTSGSYDGTQDGNYDDTGIAGTGQHFDGSNDQIVISSSESLEPSGDVEISGWFKLDSAHSSSSTTTQLLFTKYLDGDNDMHIALVGNSDYPSPLVVADGSLVFKTENGAAGQMYKWTAQTTWQAGVWYYFACYMDASTPANNKIFIGAVEDTGGTTGGITYADLSFTADWGIGGGLIDQVTGNLAWFDGVVDEVRISPIANGRAAAWRAAEFTTTNNPSVFYSVGSEIERTSPDSETKKTVNVTALAGSWTASAYFNDSGSSVSYRVGMYERTFIVRHASSLSLTAPTDAVGDSISAATIGDSMYVEVDLTDGITAAAIVGATVSMNWTVLGIGTNVDLSDFGGGLYGVALNTSDLEDNVRWRLNILSSHPFYTDASTYFYLDLIHDTELDYSDVTQTPIGFDFTATLTYRDTYDGSLLEGATITFANGNPVTVDSEGNGEYDISISTGALSPGTYWYILNASLPGSLYEMASVNITFVLRPHYTVASVSGDLVTPFGFDTPLTVVLLDLDTGLLVDISNVGSFNFTTSYGQQILSSLFSYDMTLDTDAWTVATTDVTLTIVMSNADYYNPDTYDFQVEIRKHLTSVTVIGNLVTPYGNNTPLTVIITDLDTGGVVAASDVSTIQFTTSYPLYSLSSPFTNLDVTLPTGTDSWSVGPESVTLQVTMLGSSDYQNPSNYIFQVTIRSMATYLYNEPSDLLFPNGDDFYIAVRLNVSEIGPNYGDFITGLAVDFTVSNATYTYPITINDFGFGIYNLTIAASFFPEGTYTIIVTVNPSNPNYASTQLVITFDYRPTRSDLTANLYTVSTPYDHDVTIVLFYEDLDRALGITTGTITSLDATITPTHTGGGFYDVVIDVSGLAIGAHLIDLDADADGYDPRTVTITVIITQIHTDAEPSLISLDMPVGDFIVFSIDFNDLDNSVPISSATVTNNWSTPANVVVAWTGTTWQVTFTTTGSDALGIYVVWFNFDEGSGNYYDGYCEIEVIVRSHTTLFNLVSAVEPTSFNGIVNISLRYWDWDNNVGIETDTLISSSVWNGTNWIAHTLVNDLGGFYTIQIGATLFGQGVQNFDIYFDWTGPVQQYENKMTTATANIIGVDSQLTLMQSSEPTPYLGTMNYIFNYAEIGGAGITNSSYGGGNVLIYVNFQGETVDLGQVTITEIDPVLQAGNYSISFSTTIFGRTGLVYMNVYINWSAGVAPFYTNRFDVISVRILPRDTVLSVLPPSPTAYGENGTFSFTFEDVTGGSNVPIDDNPALTIGLSLGDFSLTWNGVTHTFTVSFDTSQFGAPLGQKSFTLDVTWAGAPYYNNRTGHNVFITVTARQTVLDYQSPAPTSYLNNVTFLLNWTDIASGSVVGVTGATVTLYDGLAQIPGIHYTVTWIKDGEYQVELNTTYYTTPGAYTLRAVISTGDFFINDVSSERPFNVLYRPTLLSAEPIGPAAYNSDLVFIIDFQDRLTFDVIDVDVTFEILNASWIFNIVWQPAFQYYELTIQTSGQGLTIGVDYTLQVRATYANQVPFYSSDDTFVFFELRNRASTLAVIDTPDPTAYLENAEFRVYYGDVDSSTGIDADSIEIWKGATQLTQGSDFFLTAEGSGFYLVTLNTTALDGLAYTSIEVRAFWTSSSPYHDNANVDVDIYVTNRETNVEITNPPTEARYLDNVTFTFVYRDLGSGQLIGSITESDIQIWSDGSLLTLGDYMITKVGSSFTISISSTVLSAGLVTNYNITVRAIWSGAPYYSSDSTIVRVTTKNRVMSYTVLPAQTASYGEFLNLSFTLLDADSDIPIIGADITFDLQGGGLFLGVDFWVTDEGTGTYSIRIDTTALGTPGTYLFDLDVGWAGSSPYYLDLPTIGMTGVVTKIDTILIPVLELVDEPYSSSAAITLTYRSLLDNSLISGADMKWEWPEAFIFAGPAGPIGPGQYQASVDTSLAPVGTYVITFTIENLTAYKSAVAYVTLVITALDSDLTTIDPALPVISVNRGSALPITVYFTDGSSIPIPHHPSTQVIATIEGVPFLLTYNGTPGYYNVTLPENDETATKRAPGSPFDVIISATTQNYDPALYSFTFYVLQTSTKVQLAGDTTEGMTFVYTELGFLTVNIVLPDDGDAPFWNGTVQWLISDLGLSGNFTIDHGNGTYSANLDTTLIGYGIFPITLKFNPWTNMSLFASSQKTIQAAITQIQTSVTPPVGRDFYWGWSGYLEFIYWSESFSTGINGSDVTLTLPGVESAVAIDLNNGTYLVWLDTTLLTASSSFLPLTASFSKANHLRGDAIIQIRVLEVPTEISVHSIDYTPSYAGVIDDLINLRIPVGDLMFIDFFYNDTDDSEGFIGGLEGALATINSYLRGPTIDGFLNVTLLDLGDGLYRFVFDTMDPDIAAEVFSEEYRLYIEMTLDNRTISDILFKIEVIDIPTELVIIVEPSTWTITNGDPFVLELRYRDIWHDTGIVGANLVANASAGAPFNVLVSESSTPGVYNFEIRSNGIMFANAVGTFTISVEKESYAVDSLTEILNVLQNPVDTGMTLGLTYGVPIILVVALIGVGYLRVWSVPKRLRQINAQIKTIRKGKVPKPVGDAKSRQELITDLFNDTFEELKITRTVEQLPEESIPVKVPELGELLIQLSILTHLNQQELDEFKADIAKMKMSEQAAFVKEVIMQEAIRAARREGKTVDEIIEGVASEARQKLAGEKIDEVVVDVDGVIVEPEEPEAERVFLPEKDEVPVVEPIVEPVEPAKPEEGEDISFSSDMLSPFEIEELKKELEEKGVLPSEIDIILKQAKELPRDLLDELLKSLDAEMRRK